MNIPAHADPAQRPGAPTASASRPAVYPVIHVRDAATTRRNAEVAADAGADGVFLIQMEGQDRDLADQAREIKNRWPALQVGVNHLSLPAIESLRRNLAAGLDMTWTDDAGLNTLSDPSVAQAIADVLPVAPAHQFFGAVAFKYQAVEPDPARAARRALALGLIPTTSGPATGCAADLDQIAALSAATARRLAIASGITPETAADYVPYLSHILVATGVSVDFHELDYERLCRLVGVCHAWSGSGGSANLG